MMQREITTKEDVFEKQQQTQKKSTIKGSWTRETTLSAKKE
jgi:hypothetical protein